MNYLPLPEVKGEQEKESGSAAANICWIWRLAAVLWNLFFEGCRAPGLLPSVCITVFLLVTFFFISSSFFFFLVTTRLRRGHAAIWAIPIIGSSCDYV